MSFDIYQLDHLRESDDFEEVLPEYQDALLELFSQSAEGQARLQADPDMGFWAAQLIDYGYTYLEVTLPQMRQTHLRELFTEVFPRKITLHAPEDADDALPELIAFWEYLQREYKLPAAREILSYLHGVKPEQYKQWMNDSSKFGMAKSFMMTGKGAGFDMTEEKDRQEFLSLYNASLPRPENRSDNRMLPTFPGDWLPPALLEEEGGGRGKKSGLKAKRRRKIAKASRKKNRKRK